MFSKKFSVLVMASVLLIYCTATANAISMKVYLSEKIEKSSLIIIGTITDMGILYGENNKPVGILWSMKVKKVLQEAEKQEAKEQEAEILGTTLIIYGKGWLHSESPDYRVGKDYLTFLKETDISPGFRRISRKFREKYELGQFKHYATVFGARGAINLAKPENFENIQATEEVIKITKIKSESEKIIVWKEALKSENTVLRRNARVELARMGIKVEEEK